MVRDEILAEWQDTAPPAAGRTCSAGGGRHPRPSLHVFCHVRCAPTLAGLRLALSGEGAGQPIFVGQRAARCTCPACRQQRRHPLHSLHRPGSPAAVRPSSPLCCSGEELWPAPPQLRSFIFQREMTLVLDTIAHAEGCPGGLLVASPALRSAPVYVHLRSDLPALDRVVEWGVLGDRSTWRTAQSSVMRSLLSGVLGTLDEADATDGSNGSWSRSSFSNASASWDELDGSGPGGAAPGGLAAGGAWGAAGRSAALGTASSSSRGGGEGEGEQEQQQLQQHPGPEQQQQQPAQQPVCNGATVAPSKVAAAVPTGALAGGSGSAAAARRAVNGSSSNGSGLGAVANGAVSLATAQQQSGERAASGWLAGDALPRMPAVKAAASRQR